MRKFVALLLAFCMILGTAAGFAIEEQGVEVTSEMDPRMSEFFCGEDLQGDVKYLSDGNIVLQSVVPVHGFTDMKIFKVNSEGQPIDGMEAESKWECNSGIPNMLNSLFEDSEGSIYTKGMGKLLGIPSDFSQLREVGNFPQSWTDIESKEDRFLMLERVLPLVDPNNLFSNQLCRVLIGFRRQGESPSAYDIGGPIETGWLSQFINIGNQSVLMGVDFGETEEDLFILIGEKKAEGTVWSIGHFSLRLTDDPYQSIDFQLVDMINVKDNFNGSVPVSLEYDGSGFQILTYDVSKIETGIYRTDMNGNITDSIIWRGLGLYFDTNGNEAIVSTTYTDVPTPYAPFSYGYYKIEWGGESTDPTDPSNPLEPSDSSGRPMSLIKERSVAGKTVAVFREGCYGMLKEKDPRTGAIDYWVPLRSEEKEVRLRMPLCDVMAKVGGAAQNLEILYGEDRIQIPMTVLAVQDLLAQMPCDTDATVEIQLVRGQDGTVTVTAELFVVEQVDSMTKVVHRMPIPLP